MVRGEWLAQFFAQKRASFFLKTEYDNDIAEIRQIFSTYWTYEKSTKNCLMRKFCSIYVRRCYKYLITVRQKILYLQ